MASRDRYTENAELALQPITPTPRHAPQGELFARLALRPLPIMKGDAEDFWVLPESETPRTLH